jgi:peroxiredoxin Q/BCP
LRQDYDQFVNRGVAVIALGPDGPHAFKNYWAENDLPFIGLSDPRSRVANQYAQEVNLFKLGRMPALFVIDYEGVIRYEHYGDSMSDIPSNDIVLGVVDQIKQEQQELSHQ